MEVNHGGYPTVTGHSYISQTTLRKVVLLLLCLHSVRLDTELMSHLDTTVPGNRTPMQQSGEFVW